MKPILLLLFIATSVLALTEAQLANYVLKTAPKYSYPLSTSTNLLAIATPWDYTAGNASCLMALDTENVGVAGGVKVATNVVIRDRSSYANHATANGAPVHVLPDREYNGLWTPADLGADLLLWHDAKDTATMWQDLGGVTQSVVGSYVSLWSDKTTQNDAAFRGSLGLGGVLRTSGIEFDGASTNYLNVDLDSGMLTNRSVYTVAKTSSTGSVSSAMFTYQGAGDVFTRWGYNTDGKRIGDYWNGGYVIPAYIQWPDGFTILGFEYSPGVTVNTYTNGVFSATGTRAGTLSTYTLIRIGGGRSGIVSDYLVTKTITAGKRQKLEGYLAHKWGLTANLPADHPYKTTPPYK